MNHTITTEMTRLDSRNCGWWAVCTCGWADTNIYLADVLAAHDVGDLNDSTQAQRGSPPDQRSWGASEGRRKITVVSRGGQ
jgi:hypothetical protein